MSPSSCFQRPFSCCVPCHCPHTLPQCCGQQCWAVLVSQGDGDTQLKSPVQGGRLQPSLSLLLGAALLPPQSPAQLLHWPSRRCGANDSDEDEGLISTRRGGKRERKEKESFIARRLIPPPPDSHVLPHHPQPGVMRTEPDTRGQMGPGRDTGALLY